MNRRAAILALLAAPMAQATSAQASTLDPAPASLTLDLGKWEDVTIKYPGRPALRITAREIYEALAK